MTPTIQPPPLSPQPLQEVHLADYIKVILRRRKTFVIAFAVVFASVFLYTVAMKPVYEATATLNIKDDKAKSGVLGQLSLLASNSPIDAEIEIIKSRTISEEVVKRLHLDWQVTSKSSKAACTLLDFASTEKKPLYQLELTGPATFNLSREDGTKLGTGVAGQLFNAGGVTLLVSELRGSPGDTFKLELLNFNKVVQAVRSTVKVSELGKKTNIIRIAYQSTRPALSRDIVNAMVQAYLDQTIAFKTEEASRTVSFVEEQLKGVRQDLDKAEIDLQGYKSSTGVVELATETEELIRKFSETEKERAAVSLQKKQIEFALGALKEATRKGTTYSPAVSVDDPLVTAMSTRLAELEMQKEALLSDSTQEHPQVKTLQSQIAELQRKIRATYETAQNNLSRREGDISKRLADYEVKLKQLPLAERELARFLRVAKVNANIYTFLLQKHEEARIAKASTISNINIVDPAITPDRPVKPQKKKNILLGLLVGLMTGIGLAFFHDYMDDTIKDADEARQVLAWPLLGLIPHISTELEDGVRSDANLISYQKPKSVAAEAFRSLRTGLHFTTVRKQQKILMVTSSFPGEGKTTISANLAEILSQTGARVLLIGCDLRQPTLHQIFGVADKPGLTELLAGDCELDKVVHHTGMNKLDLITAGTIPPNPAELLGSELMSTLLSSLQEKYDHIIIDAAPVLAVSDTPILAQLCDTIVLVLEAGRVPQKAILRVQEILAAVSAPVAGFVINDKAGRAEHYGAYGSYYGYGSAYGDEGKPAAKKQWWKRFF